MENLSGQTIKGYEIRERIGLGTFGGVYRAYQPAIGRDVAIKVILPTYANHADFIRRFEAEAQLIARLEHPHIVPLFDYWREPDRAFLVMRLLPISLRAVLRRHPLTLDEAVRLVDQLSSALAMFHRQGIVHRDIKPDNILLDRNGNAYLSDFGLAKVMWEDNGDEPEEGITGSPAYMAPEQIKNEAITSQTDLYALGVVIYEMLTGHHPFPERSISSLIRRHLLDPLPVLGVRQPEEVPEAINMVIQRATEKDPALRYGNVQALTAGLREALTGQRDTLSTTEVDVDDLKNPYKGLRSFDEADAADFFGREILVEQLVHRLSHSRTGQKRFLAVVGPSGSGKSSLVKAGLIPALRQGAMSGSDRWFYVTMLPSDQPIRELAVALLSVASQLIPGLVDQLRKNVGALSVVAEQILGEGTGELVLVIDQFEETFTLTQDEAERVQFLALLRTAVENAKSRVRVIVTLRADFYDRPLLYSDFGELIQARTQVVLPLHADELERAIVAPADSVGVHVESNLSAAIIADVRQEPGALPLLQYTLTEIFERRQGLSMTLEAYRSIGGVVGALARRAEEVYDTLGLEQKLLVRQIFLRLVTLGEGAEDVRRRALRSELASIVRDNAILQEILDVFGKHRLLSFDHVPETREPTVEVAHEALLRAWTRLRQWLDASREDVRQQRRLARLATEWADAQYDRSYLLRGMQLQQFEYWLSEANIALTEAEQRFVDASVAERQAQQDAERIRMEREAALEARARRFQRRLIVLLAAGLLVAMALSFLAIDQRGEAQDARTEAEQNADLSQTQAAAAATAAAIAERRADELQSLGLVREAENVMRENQQDLGLTLAVEANRIIPDAPVQAQRFLSEIVPYAAVRLFNGHEVRINAIAMHPDGLQAISGDDNGLLIAWNIATGEEMGRFEGHTRRVQAVDYTPDGTQLLSGAAGGIIILWDVETGEQLHTFEEHTSDVLTLDVAPDGLYFASGSRDETIILWDLETGEPVRAFAEGHTDRITSLAFSSDGTYIVSGAADGSVIIWVVATGEILGTLGGHQDSVNDVAFSPDGRTILSGSSDTTLILWDAVTFQPVRRYDGNDERVTGVAFSPDGRHIVSSAGSPFAGASSGNVLLIWDLEQTQPVDRYGGHTLQVTDVVFTSDGLHLLSASADATLRQWSVHPSVETWRLTTPGVPLAVADITHDGSMVVAVDEFAFWVWQLPDEPIRIFGAGVHIDKINAIAISPDGQSVVSASSDRSLILWNLASEQQEVTFVGHTNEVNDVVFSPDGTRILSASRDRTLILWSVETGERLRTFEARHTNSVTTVAFSPDGNLALSGSDDRSLLLWDVETGTVLRVFQGHRSGVTDVAFSPDSRLVVSASQDQTLMLWDVETGAIVHSLTGHTDWVTTADFSPDGSLVISGALDRRVRLWDVESGQEVRTYASYNDGLTMVRYMPDGGYAFSASAEGLMRMLPTSAEAYLEWVTSNRYIYTLTCDEREQFLLTLCPESSSMGDPGE